MIKILGPLRHRILETFSEDTLKTFNLDQIAYREVLWYVQKKHYILDKQVSEMRTMLRILKAYGNPAVSGYASFIENDIPWHGR